MEPSDNVETASLPTVSALRSRFEQAAKPTQEFPRRTPAQPIVISDTALLAPSDAPAVRAKVKSDASLTANAVISSEGDQLRHASSSSSLKTKRPPPPPPPSSRTRESSPVPSIASDVSARNFVVSVNPGVDTGALKQRLFNVSTESLGTPMHIQPVLIEDRGSLLGKKSSTKPIILDMDTISNAHWSESHSAALLSSDSSHKSFSPAEYKAQLTRPPPPIPPHRAKADVLELASMSAPDLSTASLPSPSPPPPLPIRRPTLPVPDDLLGPPPLPSRKILPDPKASAPDRGSSRLPPPPTRTIGLGDKLPPARISQTLMSSDDEELDEAEDEAKQKAMERTPDGSASSRLPPKQRGYGYSPHLIHVPAHSGKIVVSGSIVVLARQHHVIGFDLSKTDVPLWTLEKRDLQLKDSKITSIQLCIERKEATRKLIVWVGTKDGSIIEIDVHTGMILDTKPFAHSGPVSHIFRLGETMVTLDSNNGKAQIWKNSDLRSQEAPVVRRFPERQDWVQMIGHTLWVANRPDSPTTPGLLAHHKTPVIRIQNIFTSSNTTKNLVIPAGEYVGAVTSGAVLSSEPEKVFLGHEGGSISVWAPDSTGLPICVNVIKISSSDVLCLEGVHNRLWAGNRKGIISAYDVQTKPWTMTNSWKAHADHPVVNLIVDPASISKFGELSVVSVGRDETICYWDGFFGRDWINKHVSARDVEFSQLRDLKILVITWNIDAVLPDGLHTDSDTINFLSDVLTSVESPDIVTFGFQEIVNLSDRQVTARNMFFSGIKRLDNSEDAKSLDKVSGAYSKWTDKLVQAVRNAMDPTCPYERTHTEALVGLYSCTFVKHGVSVKEKSSALVKRGLGGRYGNKGAILHRFVIDDTSFCLVNMHLAAGQHHTRERNADVAAFFDQPVFPEASPLEVTSAFVGGGDGTMTLDHDIIFAFGDMNYRIDGTRDNIISHIDNDDLEPLLTRDQLIKQLKYLKSFSLRQFREGQIDFAPTYKYDRKTNTYDTSEKARRPAWCDRILWRSHDVSRVQQIHYRRWEANPSDHRPVSSAFKVTIKQIRHDARRPIQYEVEALWERRQAELLVEAAAHYQSLNTTPVLR